MPDDEVTNETALQDLAKHLDNLEKEVKKNKKEIGELKGTFTYLCKRFAKIPIPSEPEKKIRSIIFWGILTVAALLVIAFFPYSRHAELCVFYDGHHSRAGGVYRKVGNKNTEQECAELVKATEPSAIGAIWDTDGSNRCYAAIGTASTLAADNRYRACLFTDIGYKIISSENCESKGMKMIPNKKECEKAAKLLNLELIHLTAYQKGDRSHGCTNKAYPDGSNWLNWATTESHPHNNIPCGTDSFNCICAKDECQDDATPIPSTCSVQLPLHCPEMAVNGLCDNRWAIWFSCDSSTPEKVKDTCKKSCNNCNGKRKVSFTKT